MLRELLSQRAINVSGITGDKLLNTVEATSFLGRTNEHQSTESREQHMKIFFH